MMCMMKKITCSAVLLISMILVQSCGSSASGNESNSSNGGVVSGEQVYSDNCLICHGKDGKAQMSGATDLSTSVLTHDATVEVVTHGRNGMRPFGSQLSKNEIDAVVKHIETLRE